MAAVLLVAGSGQAAISEPDNLVYGNIVLSNTLVTAARTDVVVEALRTAGGPAVATYRMGSQPAFGDFYSLRLRLESVPPLADPDAAQVGDSLFIVVRDASGSQVQSTFTVAERGQAQRLDLGGTVGDTDGDSLPDSWELLHFGNLNQTPDSLNPNGQTSLANFIAGADPNLADSAFRLTARTEGQQPQVSFFALRAEGTGYEGKQRFYSLEESPNASTPFYGVANFTNLAGNNQLVTFDLPATNAQLFYRGRVWLQ